MGLLKDLGNIIKVVAPIAITGASVNQWMNNKQQEIANNRIAGLISLACEVGRMDNDTWKLVSTGLEFKALHNSDYEFLKNYCNYVVQIEVGKFKQLLTLSHSESSVLLKDTFFRCSVEEQCVYLGLLQSRSTDMKASYLLNYLIDASKSGVSTSNRNQLNQRRAYPEGIFNRVWLEFNVQAKNEKGMYIHTDINVINSEYYNCRLIAWFFFGNGVRLEDKNDRYNTTDGQVCTYTDFVPQYENTRFQDLAFFIPYTEFHVNRLGEYKLKFYIGMFAENDKIAESDYVTFDYIVS